MSFIRLFRAGACALLTLALSSTIAVAQGNGHGHDKHDRDDDDHAYDEHDHGHGHGHGHGHEHYANHDRDIRDWYRAHYDHLPPGLAKRDHLPPGLERQLVVNGTSPPVLQTKMRRARELEAMLAPPPPNYVHVVISGNLVMYNRATLQTGDVFHLDAAF